jgi:hypothetical protein
MQEFLVVLSIIFVTFGISFVMINLRQVVTGQEFRGTCASNNPMLKDALGECTICGKKVGEECEMPEPGK